MSSSLSRKVLVWPHPDSLNHVTWSTDLRLQPLLWASYTTPITVRDSPLNVVYRRKEKAMEATCLKIWLILFVSNLSERACLWRECCLKELRQIYCPRFKYCFLASVSIQTWIHHFSDPSESHLRLVSPSPRSAAVANRILAFTQATFTRTQETRLKQESKEHVHLCNSCVYTHRVSKHMSAWAYFESGLHI